MGKLPCSLSETAHIFVSCRNLLGDQVVVYAEFFPWWVTGKYGWAVVGECSKVWRSLQGVFRDPCPSFQPCSRVGSSGKLWGKEGRVALLGGPWEQSDGA